MRDHSQVAAGQLDEDDRDIGGDRFEQRRGELAREQLRQDRGVDQPAHERIVGVGGRADVLAGADLLCGRHGRRALRRGRGCAPSDSKHLRGLLKVAIGGRARARARREPPERELADGGLIALADQLEDARALRDVVVRLGRARLARAQLAAQPQELAPGAGRRARIEAAFDLREPMLGFVDALGREQRFDRDELTLARFGRRRRRRARDFVGDSERRRRASRGESRVAR